MQEALIEYLYPRIIEVLPAKQQRQFDQCELVVTFRPLFPGKVIRIDVVTSYIDEVIGLLGDPPPPDSQKVEVTSHVFDTPSGAGWEEVFIRFTSELMIQAEIRGELMEARTFADLGFADTRGRGRKPNRQWHLLLKFAEHGGKIRGFREAQVTSQGALQKRVQKLKERLQKVFGIRENPIRFDGQATYSTKFRIEPPNAD